MNTPIGDNISGAVHQSAPQKRTERILSTATDLLLRWGYKRVTIEDIARGADVGIGTIYLHWKTKETLFETVLLRELVAIWSILVQRMRADPAEALLHRFMSALLLNIKERPLACALFTGDVPLLGRLTQSKVAQQNQQMAGSGQWIALLRRLGLLRTDTDIEAQTYAFSAIWTGFVLVDQFLMEESRVAQEKRSEALVQTIRRTFEPEILPAADALHHVVAPTIIQFLEQACAHYQQQIQERMIVPKELQPRP